MPLPMLQVGMEISVGLFFTQYKVVLSAMTLLIVGKVRCPERLVCRKHHEPRCRCHVP